MDHSRVDPREQAGLHVIDQIDDFFDKFHIGTLLDRCGIRKRHGYSVRSLTKAIFALPFIGKISSEASSSATTQMSVKMPHTICSKHAHTIGGGFYCWSAFAYIAFSTGWQVTSVSRYSLLMTAPMTAHVPKKSNCSVAFLITVPAVTWGASGCLPYAGRTGWAVCPWILRYSHRRNKRAAFMKATKAWTNDAAPSNGAQRQPPKQRHSFLPWSSASSRLV